MELHTSGHLLSGQDFYSWRFFQDLNWPFPGVYPRRNAGLRGLIPVVAKPVIKWRQIAKTIRTNIMRFRPKKLAGPGLLLLVVIATGLSGCFLQSKKKKSGKGDAGINLVDKSSIFMDRVGDGDKALVQFKTVSPAKCQLEYYSQDASSTPTKDQPGKVDCVNKDGGKTEFGETIGDLRTDTLYFVVLVVFDAVGDASKAQRLTIKESANTDTIITDGGENDPKFAALNVARLNVPLKVAEFHRFKPDSPLDVAAIKTALTMQEGCKTGVPEAAGPFSKSNVELPIANLATRDFAAGSATKHLNYPDRLQISYSGINELMEKWTLLYTEADKDHSVTARPVSRIVNLEMQSDTAVAFGEPQLAEAADPLKIDPAKPLKLNWTTGSSLLENTYMTVQIGRADNPKSVYCAFPASKRTAEIPAEVLGKLEDGRHVIHIEMAANQILLKDSWIITTYDWRSGRIEK
jgi:hypothetical protein